MDPIVVPGATDIIKSLINSGPWGILCAVELAAAFSLFMAWRAAEKELKVEIRRAADMLNTSSDAIRDNNDGRKAMIDAIADGHRVTKEILGRQERHAALLESIDRAIAVRDAADAVRRGA